MGSRIFAAQYQQNPTPPDGNMIKASWLQRYASAPTREKFHSVILSCDPAGKAGIKNDYTAITVVGVDAKQLYLLQVARGHWTVLEMQSQIVALASLWAVTQVIIENTASGMGLVQLLQEQTSLPVFGKHPTDDKETRLSRHQGRFEAGRILLPPTLLGLPTLKASSWRFQMAATTIRSMRCCYFWIGIRKASVTSRRKTSPYPLFLRTPGSIPATCRPISRRVFDGQRRVSRMKMKQRNGDAAAEAIFACLIVSHYSTDAARKLYSTQDTKPLDWST